VLKTQGSEGAGKSRAVVAGPWLQNLLGAGNTDRFCIVCADKQP